MNFNNFIGQEKAKLALVLNAVDHRCGGVILFGGRGCGKSRLIRLAEPIFQAANNYAAIKCLPAAREDRASSDFSHSPYVKMPLNATDDALLDSVDLEAAVKSGRRIIRKGLLQKAQGGALVIDDINLFNTDLLSLVFGASGQGGSAKAPGFVVLAAMNLEDGPLSPHFADRIGFGVEFDRLDQPEDRLNVLKLARGDEYENREMKPPKADPAEKSGTIQLAAEPSYAWGIDDLRRQIIEARKFLSTVEVTADMLRYINDTSEKFVAPGHRGLLFLLHGAKALAAFKGERLLPEHVDQVADLVFFHRALNLENTPNPSDQNESDEASKAENESDNDHESREAESEASESREEAESPDRDSSRPDLASGPGANREEVMKTGAGFKIKRLVFAKDRLKRTAHGRRTKTKTKGLGGRHIKSVIQAAEKDISLEATLRAAAPFQSIRHRDGMMKIEKSDLRYKQKERRMGHLVLFVVDGSGSMGAKERMTETKGAIQSILLDCYQKRDQVAMICFRKDAAEVVLPPTSSVEMASRHLDRLPVGGKTPLPHGLVEAYTLVERYKIKKPETRFIITLITDGRANQSLNGGKIQEEVDAGLSLLASLNNCDFIVIDTENKSNFLKRDLAVNMALHLEADYYTIESLKSESLSAILQSSFAA